MPSKFSGSFCRALVALTMVFTLVCQDASAWGVRGRKAVTLAALQILRTEYRVAFRTTRSDYTNDLLRGAEDGVEALGNSVPLNNTTQAIDAVFHEIQLLREVRKYGAGSYFAYRMGVLSALAGGLIVPYGVVYSDSELEMKTRVDDYVDKLVDTFIFEMPSRNLMYVRSVQTYFSARRTFFPGDQKLIRDEYAASEEAKRFLSEAGQTYFKRSYETVSDCWHTVMRPEGDRVNVVPSPRIVTDYLVSEIEFLLLRKRSMEQANRVYRIFRKVNPDLMEPYERIGDAYYALGTEDTMARGVKEWQIAYGRPGPQHERTSKKLSTHYIDRGESLLQLAEIPGASESLLPNALRSFKDALEFDRINPVAAQRITQTTKAIKARAEEKDLQLTMLDNANTLTTEAEQSALNLQYAEAILTYNKAMGLLNVVDNTFEDLDKSAVKARGEIEKSIKKTLEEVLDKAEEYIAQGEYAMDEKNFDGAITSFAMVEPLVTAISAEVGTTTYDRKESVIQRADENTNTAKSKRATAEANAVAPPVGGIKPGGIKPGGIKPGS